MSDLWALAVTAGIGVVAWLYQQAWDRRQLRLDRYQAFVDRLPGFTIANRDAAKMDEAYAELRRLWLFAPGDVIKAANSFIEAAEKGEPMRIALAKLVLAMRCDVSFRAA